MRSCQPLFNTRLISFLDEKKQQHFTYDPNPIRLKRWKITPWALISAAPVPKQSTFQSYLDTLRVLLSPLLRAPCGWLSFSPDLCQHVQKAMSGFVAISYCFNPPDHCAVDKPTVKAACRPDWWASIGAWHPGPLLSPAWVHSSAGWQWRVLLCCSL